MLESLHVWIFLQWEIQSKEMEEGGGGERESIDPRD